MDNPPRYARRAIDEAHIRAERFRQFPRDQWEMRAGQHHRVDAGPSSLLTQPFGSGLEDSRVGRFASQPRFCGMDQFRRGMAQQQLVRSEFRLKPVNIGLPDRGGGAEQADDPRTGQRGGGLDRGHCAHDRHVQRLAQGGERDGGGGVAGNRHQPGVKAFDQPAQQGGNAGGDLDLALFAIGQGSRIRDIQHRRLWQQPAQFGQHGQPAHAGIEQQDRRSWIGNGEFRAS